MSQISVIVPIFQVEKYIDKCLDSVCSQALKDIQMLLVDDGTYDRSGQSCDEYAMRDSRIIVIHKHNGGVSTARNCGLECAWGRYIGFVDGDDYIDDNMYDTLLEEAEKIGADIVYCEARFIHPDGTTALDSIHVVKQDKVFTKENWTPAELKAIAGGVPHAIYSGELIKKNKLSFPIGCAFSEDRVFNIYAMGFANKTYLKKISPYNIVLHKDSCIQRFHSDYYQTALRAKNNIEQALREVWNNDSAYQISFLSQFVDSCIIGINKVDLSGYNVARKIREIKGFCEDGELIHAINLTEYRGRYPFLIKKKKYLLLQVCDSKVGKRIVDIYMHIDEDGLIESILGFIKRRIG